MSRATREVGVLHRDEHFLVLDKPTGLPTTSPRPEATLTAVAHELDPAAPRLHPSSRLDADVTGVVIFARTREATEHLLAARAAHRYRRGYLALAAACPEPPQGEWHGAIAIDPRDARKRTVRAPEAPGARPAISHYRTLVPLARGAVLWLEPQTGRTHQLRVHAAAAGLPLLGDRPYGGPQRVTLADGTVVGARRTMLHCARVEIPSLHDTTLLRFEAPLPADLLDMARALGATGLELPGGK